MNHRNFGTTPRAKGILPHGGQFVNGRGQDFCDYALARSVRFTHVEGHAIAVSYIYKQFGRAANFMSVRRVEELVTDLIGDAPSPERIPLTCGGGLARHTDQTNRPKNGYGLKPFTTDAELVAELLDSNGWDSWDLKIGRDVALAQLTETREG